MTRPIPNDANGVPMACAWPGCGIYAAGGLNVVDGRGRVIATRRFCTPHIAEALAQARATALPDDPPKLAPLVPPPGRLL